MKNNAQPVWRKRIILVLAVGLGAFQIYTALFGILTPLMQRSIHLAFACMMVFFLKPSKWPALDIILAVASVVPAVYLLSIINTYIDRVGEVYLADQIFYVILAIILLEATRRSMGKPLVIIALVFLAYNWAGPYLPGIMAHNGYDLERQTPTQFLSFNGIFGSPLGASATYIYMFILFGALLNASGAGRVFMDLSYAAAGRFRGGPGKIAVVASALFGTISGAPVANVSTTGAFTIPLMKKVGYEPHFAAAIEAVASTGGSIMPPVMGAAAFIMSEMTGLPYGEICVAAAIPAILYYASVFFSVDFAAAKLGLKGLPASELPNIKEALKNSLLFLIPFGVLIYLLVIANVSALKAGIWSTIAVIVASLVLPSGKLSFPGVVDALIDAAKGTIIVALATATAGVVIGVIGQTGLGLKLTNVLVNLGGSYSLLLLTLAAGAGIVLGMGLPVSAAYIVLAAITGPAIVKSGYSLMAAHMFIMYFAAIAPITPPVALASFTAAGLAGSDPMKTSWSACNLGLAAFIVPFMFMYGPSLLFQGSWTTIVSTFISATIGIFGLASATMGWSLGQPLAWWNRGLALIGALLLILPGWRSDLAGLLMLVLAIGSAKLLCRAKQKQMALNI